LTTENEREQRWKNAAAIIGIEYAQYKSLREQGLLWCSNCQQWHPQSEFSANRARSTGKDTSCRHSRYPAPKAKPQEKERVRGFRYIEQLPFIEMAHLKELAHIVRAPRGRRAKGGIWKPFPKEELIRSIRRTVADTFPHLISRANAYIECQEKDNE